MISLRSILAVFLLASFVVSNSAFTTPSTFAVRSHSTTFTTFISEKKDNGVIELADDEEDVKKAEKSENTVAPFLSQGEISQEALEMDFSDPKQARVMFYIVLSLIPVLFLIPLILGSRDLIPLDALPPVEL